MPDSRPMLMTEQQKRTRFWQLEQAARHAPLTAICRACSRPRREHPDGRSRHWFVPPADSSPPPAPSPATTPAQALAAARQAYAMLRDPARTEQDVTAAWDTLDAILGGPR
jgi:hypothetical protein